MLPQTHRKNATPTAAALQSGIALKSKSILSVPRLQQLQQSSPRNSMVHQRLAKPKSQPKKLNTSTSDIFVGDNMPYANTPIKVHAAAENIDSTSALVKAYPTLPSPSAYVRSLYDAAIVLRIPADLCLSGSLSAYSASLYATSLAPPATTCEPLTTVGKTAAAIVGPEMLATYQTTCRTGCSLIRMTPVRELVVGIVNINEGIKEVSKPKKYLADYKRCWPPPLFIGLVSLLEIFVFIYDYMTIQLSTAMTTAPELMGGGGGGTSLEISISKTLYTNETSPSSSSSLSSALIYRPDRRLEIWRYVSYMTLHANWLHLSFNVVIQLMCGLPLELVHGSVRVGIIYLAGVLAGSLGTSVVDSQVYLMGTSGGVYALLTANLANIFVNYEQMRHVVGQMLRVTVIDIL
ncbi:uncharacterized protein [Eurosta solidaginis]|uniref:uncharacterized protein isoform X2 n=1 Tax=Eurosta solidaginis TaxID=178769 RepID=UPI00353160A6